MARDKKTDPEAKDVCRNRRAFHDYEVSDRLECGLVLTGTEVKSLRVGQASIDTGLGILRASRGGACSWFSIWPL